jgi:hypothetical protein
MSRFRALILAAVALLLVSPRPVRAVLGDSTGAYWGIPGVISTGQLATVFQCSNPSTTVSEIMGVFVFDANGTLVGANNVLLAPGASMTMSTTVLYSMVSTDYVNLGISGTVLGTARIGFRQLICAAWVMGNGTSPGYMTALPVLKKTKQRGQ